jgi:hypothetical protein
MARVTLLKTRIPDANARIAALLLLARRALHGEDTFGADQVRETAKCLLDMGVIAGDAKNLRATNPDVSSGLDCYKQQLVELKKTLEDLGIVLQMRRTQLNGERSHATAVSRWTETLQQTR